MFNTYVYFLDIHFSQYESKSLVYMTSVNSKPPQCNTTFKPCTGLSANYLTTAWFSCTKCLYI